MAIVIGNGIHSAQVIQVIRTVCWIRKSETDSTAIPVYEYWDLKGNRLATSNEIKIPNVDDVSEWR